MEWISIYIYRPYRRIISIIHTGVAQVHVRRSHLCCCCCIFPHRWREPGGPAGGVVLWSNELSLQRHSHQGETTSYNTGLSESITPACTQKCTWAITRLTERQQPIRRSFWPSVWTAGWKKKLVSTVRVEFRHLRAAARSGQTRETSTGCSDTDQYKSVNRQPAWSSDGEVRGTVDRQRGDWDNLRWRNPKEPWIWWRNPEHPEVPKLPTGKTLQGTDSCVYQPQRGRDCKPDDADG